MPTWEEIEDAARHDPLLHQAVSLDRIGTLTREEILIGVALTYAATNAHLHKMCTDLIAVTAPPIVFANMVPNCCPFCGHALPHK